MWPERQSACLCVALPVSCSCCSELEDAQNCRFRLKHHSECSLQHVLCATFFLAGTLRAQRRVLPQTPCFQAVLRGTPFCPGAQKRPQWTLWGVSGVYHSVLFVVAGRLQTINYNLRWHSFFSIILRTQCEEPNKRFLCK